MSYKIYKKGNYFIIDDYTQKLEYLAYNIKVEEDENFNYFNIIDLSKPNSVIVSVQIGDLYNESNSLYTLETWKDFYTFNTGLINVLSSGGGGDASAFNQVTANNKLATLETVVKNTGDSSVSDASGFLILAKRRDSDNTLVNDGEYNSLNMDETGRLKVASQPASYSDIVGDITAVQATVNTPVVGGTVVGNVSRASNLMAFCTGTFSGINVTFEGSLDDTGDANWFGIQAVRTNANTIETTTGALSAQPTYGWELSVNALKRFRVRCTARTSGTQSWKFVLGTYATEPIPASQVTATQPVSFVAGTNLIGDIGIQYRANATGAASRIKLFKVTGVDVECAVVGGSYSLGLGGMYNTPEGIAITYFYDNDGLVVSCGTNAIYNINIQQVYLPNCTSFGGGVFNQNLSYAGQLKNNLKLLYAPKLTSIGPDNLGTGNAFVSGNLGGGKIYVNDFLRTSNAGNPEAEIAYLATGNSIRYVTNFTPPNTITNLSQGIIYNTAVQLNFTPPSSTNGIDFYEVYINGEKFNSKEIKNSGDFITGLLPNTTYSIQVKAVDMFYNKSAFSNAVNVTTTNYGTSDANPTIESEAYISAANITDSTQQTAVRQLYFQLMNQGYLYGKLQAFYLFLGTTQAQHKWNGKNPQDTNAAFRLQFFGGGTHSNLGYQCNGTNARADTFFNPRVLSNQNSNGFTIVSGTNNTVIGTSSNSRDMGCYDSETSIMFISPRLNNTTGDKIYSSASYDASYVDTLDAKGILTGTRQTLSTVKLFKNGVQKVNATKSSTILPNRNIYIGAHNVSNNGWGWSTQRIQFTAIHEGLTDAEVVALHTIIDNFETAIGRKTW